MTEPDPRTGLALLRIVTRQTMAVGGALPFTVVVVMRMKMMNTDKLTHAVAALTPFKQYIREVCELYCDYPDDGLNAPMSGLYVEAVDAGSLDDFEPYSGDFAVKLHPVEARKRLAAAALDVIDASNLSDDERHYLFWWAFDFVRSVSGGEFDPPQVVHATMPPVVNIFD